MIYLAFDLALTLLKKAVEEKGEDFVYQQNDDDRLGPMCLYVKDGEPDCIVGHVLAGVGVDLEATQANRGGSAGVYIGDLALRGILRVEDRAVRLLSSAQLMQDQGFTWGESLKYAIERANTYLDD